MPKPRKSTSRNKRQNPTPQRARTQAWRKVFIASLSQNGNVTDACETAGIHRSVAYDARSKDEAFAALWDETIEIAVDRLESEAWRRAAHGVNKPVWYKGDMVGTELEFSDQLMVTLLKAHRPEKYKERVGVEYSMPPELVKLLKERNMKPGDIFEAMIQEFANENTPTKTEDNPK